MPLTAKQQRFVREYVKDSNASQASIRAGYSRKNANVNGPRLLAHAGISREVAKRQAAALQRADLSADIALESIRKPLAADVRKLFYPDGRVRPITELSAEEASLIAGYEVIVKNAKAGDGHTDEVLKVKLVDRSKYVELAAKHFRLLHDHKELTINVNVVGRLQEARRRVAQRQLPQGVVDSPGVRVLGDTSDPVSDGGETK
jgi:phage terminase small subunit